MGDLPTISGYEVEHELGRGGMGVAYKCSKPPAAQPVAVKLMIGGRYAGLDQLARFRIEAEALCCLDHENIVKVLDVGVSNGCPYLAMEFASNGTLKDYLKTQPQSIEWVVRTIRKVALAVQHAHARRILHRDLKPANILVMGDGTPKVADFGFVKFTAPMQWVGGASRVTDPGAFEGFDQELKRFADELRYDYGDALNAEESIVSQLVHSCASRTGIPTTSFNLSTIDQFVSSVAESTDRKEKDFLQDLTAPDAVFGTPQFMAPEQANGRHDLIGPATDVYSLGATLYALVTGRPMFTGSLHEVITKVRNEWPIPPREVSNEVPESVEAVIWKCIQKDPTSRYGDCQSLADELERCLDGRLPVALRRRMIRENRYREQEDKKREDKKKVAELWANAFPLKSSSQTPADSLPAKPWWRKWF